MKPTIHLVSTLLRSTQPDFAGGLEVFNSYLAKKLVDRGWDVKVYATGDSEVAAPLIPLAKQGLLNIQTDKEADLPWLYRRATVEEFGSYAKLVHHLYSQKGVVHFSTVNFLPIYLASKYKLPMVTTFHMPLANRHYQLLAELLTPEEQVKINAVGISKDQTKAWAMPHIIIPNGVDLADFPFSPTSGPNFIWIGRLVAEKGVEQAIVIAKEASIDLNIGGYPKDQAEQHYFDATLKPQLTNRIKAIGKVSRQQRPNFYQAKALLLPLQWDEPFGLTIIEAMACGTPVVAYNRGAASELIEDGVTGYLCPANDRAAIIKAIQRLTMLTEDQYQAMRQACRARVESYYSIERMVNDYEKLYRQIGQS